MRYALNLLLVTLLLFVSTANATTKNAIDIALPTHITKFAFASCAKERKPQPIWHTIAATNPQLFLFIGDNVYADYWRADGANLATSPVTDVARIKQAYNTLSTKPEFAEFRTSIPLLGVWDDHDYGANDAGKHYPLKAQSQQQFLDFFGFASDDPIRQQEGIYHARVVGSGNQRVQFILLDTRYHRDDLIRPSKQDINDKRRYIPSQDPAVSMLGEQQWLWLKEQLQQPAEVRFIVSSIQVVAYEHGWETWGNMPHERQRLFDLIAQTKASGVVFLSGDRHLTEVSVNTGQLGDEVPYPMWDLTSSGMTDEVKAVDEANSFRRGAVYRGSHFATVDIDWQTPVTDSKIVFRAMDAAGKLINEQVIKLGRLQIH